MNSKMTKKKNLPTIESKKQTKQIEQRQNHGYKEHFVDCQLGGACGGMGEDVRRLRSTNR